MGLTDEILDLAATPPEALPEASLRLARLSLFDWLACGLGAAGEPVTRHVLDFVQGEGGIAAATAFGGARMPARAAALANGTISHALDYDDTHFAHIGHLSVGIFPAALAAGEMTDASLAEVIAAFLVGAESAIRIGVTLGAGHYERGFHQTATAGAFGATVAAGRLFGLTRAQMRAALGLCATRANGLKSQFGTMGKPLNAGFAASNGVECARFAALGLTSADDGLAGPQGFLPTHSDAPAPTPVPAPGQFLFDDIRYKLHACCHGTHAMIEALQELRDRSGLSPQAVEAITVTVHPRWLKVCDIKQPRTGLEVKFSYTRLAAMVLSRVPTADPDSFTDAVASDPSLGALAARVRVDSDPGIADTAATVRIVTRDGTDAEAGHDLMTRFAPAEIEARVTGKVAAVIGQRAGPLWTAIAGGLDAPASEIARHLVFNQETLAAE